ncbi:DUF1360 domain-containing protein [Streptomyces sparsogenes]|uniref:DUF1360 domain-containing protein n=1 Tax=Streptomyces sparsogenes TaxID=67365 RepID=UPI0033FFA843
MDRNESRGRPAGAAARWAGRLTAALRGQKAAYAGDSGHAPERYAAAMLGYGAYVAALAGAGRLTGRRLPCRVDPWDLALCAVATFRLSRLLTKSTVASPLRVPFTVARGGAGAAELSEEARGEGGRRTVGELITCPFCTDMWVATTITAGLVLCPRATRLATAALTAVAGADALQFAYAAMVERERDGAD